jgi:hypothetical protein
MIPGVRAKRPPRRESTSQHAVATSGASAVTYAASAGVMSFGLGEDVVV